MFFCFHYRFPCVLLRIPIFVVIDFRLLCCLWFWDACCFSRWFQFLLLLILFLFYFDFDLLVACSCLLLFGLFVDFAIFCFLICVCLFGLNNELIMLLLPVCVRHCSFCLLMFVLVWFVLLIQLFWETIPARRSIKESGIQ